MRFQIIGLSFAVLFGFMALPAEAHIAVIGHSSAQVRAPEFIQQNLEKILPDIDNMRPELYLDARYDLTVQPKADDGADI